MNKSVPTLLGIVIILLVVVLVVLVFNYKLTQQLGTGASVVGTVGGQALTGVQPPKAEIGTSEVLGARQPEAGLEVAPGQRPETRAGRLAEQRQGERGARWGARGRAAKGAKPGG